MARDPHPLAQQLPVVVWESDARGACTFVNRRWTELTGQRADAALGEGWRACFVEEDLAQLEHARRDALVHHLNLEVELRLKDVGAALRWVRLVATPELRAGRVMGFVGVLLDVTALRQAVVEHAERESHLRLLEARSHALLENLPDLLFQFDAAGRFVDFQASSGERFLLTPEQFLGRRLGEILPPAIGQDAEAALEAARRTGQPQRHEYALDVPGLGVRDFEARISPMKSGGFLGLVRDVTELKRSERQLIDARERALSASSSKSQFLANVSHEIRTPLNGIIGVTQLLRTLVLPDEAREYVALLEGAGEALLALVNEVLDLSKIEADRLELSSAPFDLAALVTQATRSFGTQAQRKRLSLEVVIDPTAAGIVLGDAARVRQIVTNLVGNAVKFTDVGAVTVSVRRANDGVLVLSVSDTGPGIPVSVQASIFEPFVQASGHRAQGTGLGLSISQRLARLMGGELRLSSAEGQGSTFEARLPLPVGRELAPPLTPVPHGPRLKVLVAEDNEVNARLTRAMLEWLGHDVETVRDGRAVVEAALGAAWDVVFMDVQMPLVDGLEATRMLRSAERTRKLPVVALTANALKGDEQACYAAGMNAYLAKPVTVEGLREVLARVIGVGR